MTTYTTLPFELRDIIMSKLCKIGTYKDIIEYGLTSKYHYELLKQNIEFKNVKQTIRFLPIKSFVKENVYKGYHLRKEGNCITILISHGIHLLDGIWINNCVGNLTSAEFSGNETCIEKIDNMKFKGGWVPFSFSKYHGKDIPRRSEEYNNMFKPFKFNYSNREIFVQGGCFSINS